METSRWNIHDLTQMALLVALLSVSAYIAFPIPITLVSVTAQTLFLNLTALLLDRRKAAVTVAVWILLGAVGVPVYSGGRGGLSQLFGPTGGFIFAFLLAAYLGSPCSRVTTSPCSATCWSPSVSASPSLIWPAPPGTWSTRTSAGDPRFSPPPCPSSPAT